MSRDFARFKEPDWELPPEHTCDECGEGLNCNDTYYSYCGGNYCKECGDRLMENDSDFALWAEEKIWY